MTTAESPPPADAEHHTTYLDLVDPETGFTVELTSSHPKPIDTWLVDIDNCCDSFRLRGAGGQSAIAFAPLHAHRRIVAFLLGEIEARSTVANKSDQSWTIVAYAGDEEKAAYHFHTRAVGYKATSAIHGREEGREKLHRSATYGKKEPEPPSNADEGFDTVWQEDPPQPAVEVPEETKVASCSVSSHDLFLALLQVHERELEARREDMRTLHMTLHTVLKALLPPPKSEAISHIALGPHSRSDA